jgi:hypothetical protein
VKALVFLLVLGNLLFYAFSQGYFGESENPDASRVDKQVLPERMRIVSRGEAPAVKVKAAEPVKPAPVAEEVKPEPVAKPEPLPTACLAWEHLSADDADRLAALLANKFAGFKTNRRIVAAEGSGWWVFVPPLASKAEAEKKAAELRQIGVSDYFIIQDGANRFAISLGVFSSEKGGQERLAEVKDKGVRSARLTPRPGKDSTVNLQATGPAPDKAALLAAVAKALPKAGGQSCK